MSWFPVSTAAKLDLSLDRLEDDGNYNFRRLFGTTSSDPESHGGSTTATLFLSMLSVLGAKTVKKSHYFMDIGAGLGQPVLLMNEMRAIGFCRENMQIIGIERDAERVEFLSDRVNAAFRSSHAIEVAVEVWSFDARNLNSGHVGDIWCKSGIVYWNNLVWGADVIQSVEKLMLDHMVEGTWIISTREMFLSKDSLGRRQVVEEIVEFEIENNGFSWRGSKAEVEVFFYRVVN